MHALMNRLKRAKEDENEYKKEDAREPEPDAPVKRSRAPAKPASNDPNIPKKRLHLNQICLYERRLPGKAYISAHVNRLQHGFHKSNVLHDPAINHVYFVSVRFVFHPHDPEAHRFKSAEIRVSLHNEDPNSTSRRRPGRSHPRILKHAPELMFGAVSPENLQWNFSLSSSLGVSAAAPVSASVNPKASVQSSYKIFHMMSIQGSIRSRQDESGHSIEDSTAVWTLNENMLQRSGLPREFDFVMLVQKPKDVKNLYMTVSVDASVAAWYGAYPQWYNNLSEYLPSQTSAVSFEHDIGQRFLPSHPGLGYNFADLMHALDQYVMMPGTVYPTTGTTPGDFDYSRPHRRPQHEARSTGSDHPPSRSNQSPMTPNDERSPMRSSGQRERRAWASENVNVHVVLDHRIPRSPDRGRFAYPPPQIMDIRRHPSIRRRKSRTRLKDHSDVEFRRTYTR